MNFGLILQYIKAFFRILKLYRAWKSERKGRQDAKEAIDLELREHQNEVNNRIDDALATTDSVSDDEILRPRQTSR